uniref:Uncharacterized protein n=1 Tax=Meloidogyne enterolobii TaxID=390850 RepID=A0A6V7TSP2_MELEN|nr:unnamed protein product [Meloidogyne enterolobii]
MFAVRKNEKNLARPCIVCPSPSVFCLSESVRVLSVRVRPCFVCPSPSVFCLSESVRVLSVRVRPCFVCPSPSLYCGILSFLFFIIYPLTMPRQAYCNSTMKKRLTIMS